MLLLKNKNPIEEVIKLSQFLGNELSEEQARQLVAYCSLTNMQKSKSFEYLKNSAVYEENFSFFRKAQIGNWREHFSRGLARRVDETVTRNLNYTGVFKDATD
jgi:hypothetical protein